MSDAKPDLPALWAALEQAHDAHEHELLNAKHAMSRLRHAYAVWEQALAAYESAAGITAQRKGPS